MMVTQNDVVVKLNQYIEDGRAKSTKVVQSLIDEAEARISGTVHRDEMNFRVAEDGIFVTANASFFSGELRFTDWSLNQLRSTIGVPANFLTGLQKDEHSALATQIINGLRDRIGSNEHNGNSQKRLLRAVHGELRGFLSPSYKIIDQKPLVEGLAVAVRNSNALFIDGAVSDHRYALTAIHPQILSPIPGEFVVAGVTFRSSDYGGALEVAEFLYRLICKNGAMGSSVMRKYHRGSDAEYGTDRWYEVSKQTLELTAASVVSEMGDAVSSVFSDDHIQKQLTAYAESAVKVIDPEAESKRLRKNGTFNDSDTDKSLALIKLHQAELIPETENENSALRWGNVLSLMAGQSEGEKKMVLEEAAGKYYLN